LAVRSIYPVGVVTPPTTLGVLERRADRFRTYDSVTAWRPNRLYRGSLNGWLLRLRSLNGLLGRLWFNRGLIDRCGSLVRLGLLILGWRLIGLRLWFVLHRLWFGLILNRFWFSRLRRGSVVHLLIFWVHVIAYVDGSFRGVGGSLDSR